MMKSKNETYRRGQKTESLCDPCKTRVPKTETRRKKDLSSRD